MQKGTSVLGTCPRCDRPIHERDRLITYETDDGWPATYAECTDCEDVVHPR